MRTRSFLAFGVLSITAGVACSSSDPAPAPAATPAGTVHTDQAKASAAATIQASVTAVQSNDGQSSAMQFQSAAAQAQGIVTPGAMAAAALAGLTSSLAGGTCTCDAAAMSCTFQDCGDASGTTINGTESWMGGHVLCDLSFKTTSAVPLSMTTKCDLTASATQIDGTLASTGTVDLGGVDAGIPAGAGTYSWAAKTTFTKVGISNGKATSGSVTVHATYSIGGKDYTGDATVTYP